MNTPDEVKRITDAMSLHAVAGARGYAVFSLADGRPITMDTYPSRGRARTSAQKLTADALLIVEVSPDGMPANEASAVLRYERTLHDMGYRTPDTLETEQNSGLLAMPRTSADRKRMAVQLITGKPLYHPETSYGNLPPIKET